MQDKKTKFNFRYYNTIYTMLVKKAEKKYKPIIDKTALQTLDEPCLIFGNHGSIFDFILAGSAILPKKAVYVVTRRTMYKRPFNWVVNRAPHILRDQFHADVRSIIDMKNAIKQGYNVVLYPEGKVSTVGVTNHIPLKATAKLVKLFNVPVVTIISKGNWLLKPSWAKHLRKGRIEISTKLILDKEQIGNMSIEEIEAVILKEMQYNDNLYQIENNCEFYGKNYCKGLEKVLYKCPNCGKEFVMDTTDTEIFCKECGFRATYNHNGLITSDNADFHYNRIDLWFDYEKQSLKKELEKDDFKLTCPVTLYETDEIKVRDILIGKGVLSIDKENIRFITNDKKVQLLYPITKVEGIPFRVGVEIYLNIDDRHYEFRFGEKMMSTKFDMVVELLAEERNVKK